MELFLWKSIWHSLMQNLLPRYQGLNYMHLVDLDVIFTNVSFVANSSSTWGIHRFHKQCDLSSLCYAGYCFVLPLIAAGTWWSFVQASGDKLPVEVCDQAFSGIPEIYKINWVFGNYNEVVNKATLLQQYVKSIQFASKVHEFNEIYKNTDKLSVMGD